MILSETVSALKKTYSLFLTLADVFYKKIVDIYLSAIHVNHQYIRLTRLTDRFPLDDVAMGDRRKPIWQISDRTFR